MNSLENKKYTDLELNKMLQDATANLEEPYNSLVLAMVDRTVKELQAIENADLSEGERILKYIGDIEIGEKYGISSIRRSNDYQCAYEDLMIILKKSKLLEEKVKAFMTKHMAYPYDENGGPYNDEYTKDYQEIQSLLGGENDE